MNLNLQRKFKPILHCGRWYDKEFGLLGPKFGSGWHMLENPTLCVILTSSLFVLQYLLFKGNKGVNPNNNKKMYK